MPVCSVLVCRKRSSAISFKTSGITYHRYPNDPIIKEKWIIATGRQKQSWFPTKSSTICSAHFDKSSFQTTKKSRRLFPWAIPTKNLRLVFADDISTQPTTSNDNGYVEIKIEPVEINSISKEDENEPLSMFKENRSIKTEVAESKKDEDDVAQPVSSKNITIKTEVLDCDEHENNEQSQPDTEMLPTSSSENIENNFDTESNTPNQSMYNHMDTNEQNRYLLGVIESKEDMIKFQKRKVKTLQTAVRRYKKKIAAMYQIVNELKKNSSLDVEKLYEDLITEDEPTE